MTIDWARRAVWTILALSLLAFVVRGATKPEDPYFEEPTVSATETGSGRVPIEGFGEVAFTTGVGEWCALLADTPALRQQGLMGQDDLNGYDAMVFRFDEDGTGGFWMKDTRIPLTVAYFDARGGFVSSADMQPCPEGTERCPSYPPTGPYRTAVEVPLGGLDDLGLGPGSTLTFGGGGCSA